MIDSLRRQLALNLESPITELVGDRGFDSRERTVACGVLSHNLLWIAHRSLQDMSQRAEAA